MSLKINNSEKDLGVGMWNLAVDPTLWVVIRLIIKLILQIPATLVDVLVRVGRGVRAQRNFYCMMTSLLLFWLSKLSQNLAGDGLFLLWAVFTSKWLVDLVWAITRRSRGSEEHRYHPGVSVLQVIGLRNDYLAALLVGGFGILVSGTEQGRFAGPLLAFGSIAAVLVYAVSDGLNRVQEAAITDQEIESKMRAGQPGRDARRPVSPVEIE